jgi:hypothetical protein
MLSLRYSKWCYNFLLWHWPPWPMQKAISKSSLRIPVACSADGPLRLMWAVLWATSHKEWPTYCPWIPIAKADSRVLCRLVGVYIYSSLRTSDWLYCMAGIIDSEEHCTSLILSWDLLGHTGQESIMKLKRSQAGQSTAGCSCVADYPSTTEENIATTITGTIMSAQPSGATCATDSVSTSISSTRTIASSAQPLQSPTATALPSSVLEPVCIIKFEDLNSNPPGKCYCSDGTKTEWKTGKCEVYSWIDSLEGTLFCQIWFLDIVQDRKHVYHCILKL